MIGETLRIAAVGDIHCTKTSHGAFQPLFGSIADEADILVLCGDLTDHGTTDEAHVLARELTASLKVPVIAVLGNHDYEANQQDEIMSVLTDAGVTVLDGESYEFHGIGFAGVKGFAGGFGRWTLAAWGEESIKKIVHEAIDEALKLESALARLRTQSTIVLMHYSPILATVEGEPVEIYPFLGSSRLEEPLARFPVTAVFHGHAHCGTPEGATSNGAPVYNVAMPLLRSKFPNSRGYRIVEVPVPKPPLHAQQHADSAGQLKTPPQPQAQPDAQRVDSPQAQPGTQAYF